MIKLTDMGRMLCDTVGMLSYTFSSVGCALYYKNEIVTWLYNGATEYTGMAIGGCYALKHAFPSLIEEKTTSLSVRYGEELQITSGFMNTGNYSLNKIDLPKSVICTRYTDPESGYSYFSGIISNNTDENITIKYLGMGDATLQLRKSSTSSADSQYVNVGLLSYFEFPEPITLAPGEDYPFKISLN